MGGLQRLAFGLCTVALVIAPTAPVSADHPAGSLTPYEWACPQGQVPEDGFGDVPARNVHEAAIDCAAWLKLVSGTSRSTYTPGGAVTRGQMATFIARLLTVSYYPLPGDAPDAFRDDDGNVHERRINQLAAVGIVAGKEPRRYAPAARVTRAQMATYLIRSYELARRVELPAARDHFADDDGIVHEPAINQAASLGIASGAAGERFAPGVAVRRDQMARFLATGRGCMTGWKRGGTYHEPRCDSYTDTEGAAALQGFDVTVRTPQTHYTVSEPVPVTVEACNRREQVVRQTFPQKDWFTLEARNEHLPLDEHEYSAGFGELQWYDHRQPGSLNGSGYGERATDVIHDRIGDRHPRLVALTWYDGPQDGPDDVVVWQPGECKTLDVGAWQQGDKSQFEDPPVAPGDYPAQWRHRPQAWGWRATPGWYTLHLSWGGVEVDQTRRYLAVESARFNLDGPRIFTTLDRDRYGPDEPVVVTVHACNDSDRPYSESMPGEAVLRLLVRGQLHHWPHEVGQVPTEEAQLAWEPGECKAWDLSWDQRFDDDDPRVADEQVQFQVEWNWEADTVDRSQDVRGRWEYLQ